MRTTGKKILMVLDGPFPPDPRVEKEAQTLKEAGFEVMLFCLQKGNHLPKEESVSFGYVTRVCISRLMHKFSALAYTFPFYKIWLAKRLLPVIKSFVPDAVHIHDMQAAEGVFSAVKKFGLNPKVILDLHENRPEIMRYYHHVNTLQGRILIDVSRWKLAEERAVNKANAVIVVTPEAKEELQGRPTITQTNIRVVPNTVPRNYALSTAASDEISARLSGKQNILYLGDTGRRRGIETAIRALPLLSEEFPNIQLVLVGKSKADSDYARMASELGVGDKVLQEGWQSAGLFPVYLRQSLVGISPLHRNPHHDTTYANKIFQYMAFGLPLLVSDCPTQARIVLDFQCGLIHPAEDARAMADGIRKLLQNHEATAKMGQNAHKAVEEKLCWEIQKEGLIDCYQQLLGAQQVART